MRGDCQARWISGPRRHGSAYPPLEPLPPPLPPPLPGLGRGACWRISGALVRGGRLPDLPSPPVPRREEPGDLPDFFGVNFYLRGDSRLRGLALVRLKVMDGSHRPAEFTAAELALLLVTKIRIEEDGFLGGIQEEIAAVLVALSGLELRAFSPFPFSEPLFNPRPVDVGAAVIVGAATSDPRAHFGVERTDTAEIEAEVSETHQTPSLVGNNQFDGEQSYRTVKVTLGELQGEGGTGPARTFAEKTPIGPAGADDDRECGDRVGDDITDDLYVFEAGEWWCGQEAGYKRPIGYRLVRAGCKSP